MVTKRNIFMTGTDSTNTSKYSSGLPDTSHLLHMPVCLSVFVLPRGESAYSSRGHSSGQSVWNVCDSSEEGQHEVRSAACHINALELCLPLSALLSHPYTESVVVLPLNSVCVCLYLHLQALGGRWPNSARPCGELWAPRGLVDSASHHHHAPLRRVWWPTGLAYPAQEPFPAEPVGGKLQEARKKSPHACGQVLKIRYPYYFHNDVINPAFHWLENSTQQWSKKKDIINKNEEWECDDRYGGGEGDQIPLLCFCSTALRANASLQPGADIVNLV